MQIGNAKRFEKLFVEGCINCMLFSHVYLAVGRHSEHKIPKCFLSQRWWFHVRIGASCSTGFRGSLRCHCNQGRGLEEKKQGTAWKLLLSLQDEGSLPACNVPPDLKCGSFLQIQMFLSPYLIHSVQRLPHHWTCNRARLQSLRTASSKRRQSRACPHWRRHPHSSWSE